jgi:hypothetical protein
LAVRLCPIAGLAAVATSLDTLVQRAEWEHGDRLAVAVERAVADRDADVQAALESMRSELASAMARVAALKAQLHDRAAALTAMDDVAACLTAFEAQLAAVEGDGDAAEGDGDGEGDWEGGEVSSPEPEPQWKRGKSKEDKKVEKKRHK